MAFKLAGSLNPHGGPILRSIIVANSRQVSELDALEVTSGFATTGTAGTLLLGHAKAIVTNGGVGVDNTGVAGSATGSFVGTYTFSSTNQTSEKVRVMVDVSKATLYSADPDATIGTTTGSNLLGYHTDLIDEDSTDEDTATTGTAQYAIHGTDPLDSGNQIVNIYESVIFGV